ncbi:unnamed protein product [Heterobilharzia americana]|nr:unnamed protein product [Heterobilharzia americana]
MSKGDVGAADGQQQVEDEYLKEFVDLSPSGDRGVLKKIVREGNCEVQPCDGDTVIVHYVGTYYGGDENGKVFDSSRERNEKFEFTIGKGDVIKAWDIGVATMKLGEVCELIAAPEYAYMDGKALKFEVELFDTLGSDVSKNKDGSVRKSTIRKGIDIHNPIAGAEATILFRNLTEMTEDVEVTYCVGDPTPEVPEELDLAIRHMNTDELSRNRVVYQLTLKSFEKTKHLSGISSFPEQMEYANTLKEKANSFLKESKYDPAIELYKRLDDELQYIVASGPDQLKLSEIVAAVRLNSALAYLKLGKPDKCIEFCKKVLDTSPGNEKALFRMGQAHILRRDHEEAAVYFKMVVKRNPSNSSAVKQLQLCEQVVKKAKDTERRMLRGVFERCKETGLGGAGDYENGAISVDEKSAV